MKQLLKQAQLKVTKKRLAVLDILHNCEHPLDIIEISKNLQQQHLPVDQVTLYRMMDQFIDKHIVRRIDFQEGKYRYELDDDHHHHLVCQRCGNITPIHDQCLGIDEQTIAQKYHFNVDHHSLEFFGTCSNCQ